MPQTVTKLKPKASGTTMVARGKSAEISIYENIGQNWWGDGLTAKRFEKELKALGEIDFITLRINSGGGSVFDGNAIYNILRSHKASVHTVIDGVAASIASVIALAGDTIEMPENAMMMIHNPMNAIFGNAIEMRKMADDLDKIKESILNVYASKTGQDKDKLSDLMDKETWFTADEAVELGFADSVTAAQKAVAGISLEMLSMFHHVPGHLLQAVPLNVLEDPQEEEPMSVQNPATPSAGQITLTQAELDAAIAKGVAAAVNPQIQKMNEDRLNGIRMRFAGFVSGGKITPAQSKLFGLLAENLMAVDATLKFSTNADGSNEQTGSPVDALFALADTLNHGLLQEQVAAGDKGAGQHAAAAPAAQGGAVATVSGAIIPATAASWKPNLDNIPDNQKKCASGYVMDQYIREVIMPANPGMKYADAAMVAEKDANLVKLLDKYDYIPDA